MLFSTLVAFAAAFSGDAAAAVAATAPSPVVLSDASTLNDEIIAIPTLVSRAPFGINKRADEFVNHGWVKVGDGKDKPITMNEPKNEIWCWYLDAANVKTDDKKGGHTFNVKKGSICYFYQVLPCDPGKKDAPAFFAIGNDSETAFPKSKNPYKTFGCEKWPKDKGGKGDGNKAETGNDVSFAELPSGN